MLALAPISIAARLWRRRRDEARPTRWARWRVQFAGLSLVAFGGANAVIPEIHRQSVEVHHWMTDKDFAALFAIAQAAPGPNFLVATLVGWKAAGPGALVATAAMCGPSCVLTFWVAKAWDRYRETAWRIGDRRGPRAGDGGLRLLQRLRAGARRRRRTGGSPRHGRERRRRLLHQAQPALVPGRGGALGVAGAFG